MERALRDYVIEGPQTTIPAHLLLLEDASFVAGAHTTRTVEDSDVLDALVSEGEAQEESDVLLVSGRPVRLWHPAMSASASAAVHGSAASTGDVVAPMQGTIVKVLVKEGDAVESGAALVLLEAMKMETSLTAQQAGTVVEVAVAAGQTAQAGQLLVKIE
jgi:biotin carboxyl carrier protein